MNRHVPEQPSQFLTFDTEKRGDDTIFKVSQGGQKIFEDSADERARSLSEQYSVENQGVVTQDFERGLDSQLKEAMARFLTMGDPENATNDKAVTEVYAAAVREKIQKYKVEGAQEYKSKGAL